MISLNREQKAAVTAADGPLLVLAGAGSGKTRVIIERMAWLVEERGVDPRYLLALTFTNKAAAEMRERFARRLEVDRVASWLGTFHSFALFVLRREIEHLGRNRNFTVFDAADQLSLMKRLVKAMPREMAEVSPRDALHWISNLKQEVKAPDHEAEPDDRAEIACRYLWDAYHAALKAASAVDFDDLLVLMVELLRDCPDVRERYQQRYRHVLVDEYQDTNRAQYLIARYLSEGHGNIFAVGDEDQSIYSWRGADINNILDFSRDFPDASVVRLEQNYRSTQTILDAANNVVQHNINRLGKTLRTESGPGDRVGFYLAETGEEEADFVIRHMARKGYSPAQVAVLYRTNNQARLIEEALRAKDIHYTVVGGIKFYSRKEIKDVLAYLRVLANPIDDEALRRIINVPARGIGATTQERLEEYAQLRKCSLLQVMRDTELDETLPGRARKAAGELVHLIDDLALDAKELDLGDLVEKLLDETGYRDFIQQSDEKDFRTRLESLDEFVVSCRTRDAKGERGLLPFLQDLSLIADVDTWDSDVPAVTLMTIHSAKGLEFDYVYLIGLEEGLLPFGVDFGEEDNLEEERRLCYVAMTRARQGLVLSAATSRMLYGRTHPNRTVSRFVGEAGRNRLEHLNTRTTAPVVKAAPPNEADAPEPALRIGTQVRHAKFGPGTVMFTSGSGDKLKARIRFKTGRTALLMVKQAPLEILEGKGR
ncbi:MAG: UvrD-helicase domain-containing protein [Candidatus Hydrogenedentes bacterium]|nr:UvrD-helicase domain-containing protein [Candidatus Hydrogenedentota bacterium]